MSSTVSGTIPVTGTLTIGTAPGTTPTSSSTTPVSTHTTTIDCLKHEINNTNVQSLSKVKNEINWSMTLALIIFCVFLFILIILVFSPFMFRLTNMIFSPLRLSTLSANGGPNTFGIVLHSAVIVLIVFIWLKWSSSRFY
jgi:hypothetical protein